MHVKIYTDGGARGNPGPSGCGVSIQDEQGKEIFSNSYPLGHMTNNQAEYWGAHYGISEAINLGATRLDVCMDSELVVKQLRGEYKIKDPGLRELATTIQAMTSDFKGVVSYFHIPREQNKRADHLSNVAMDEVEFTLSRGEEVAVPVPQGRTLFSE